MVGKYTDLSDAYLSVTRALQHAAIYAKRKLIIDWIESTYLEPEVPPLLSFFLSFFSFFLSLFVSFFPFWFCFFLN